MFESKLSTYTIQKNKLREKYVDYLLKKYKSR